MEHMKSSPSTENDASNMNEFLRALSDIQSINIDELKAQCLQSLQGVSENAENDDLIHKTNHNLEDWKRETDRLRKCLKEEQNFKKEYESVFGERKINDLHKMMVNLDGVNEKLEEEKAILKRKNTNLQEEKRKALEEKADALTRLSKQMVDQLTNNNPNIADLSDQNRPNKIGERYSELYDNQWTKAFEVLTETHRQQEQIAIEILLNLLYECHNFAKATAEKQMADLLTLVSGDSQMQVIDEVKGHLKKARKLIDVTRADLLFENCARHVKNTAESARLYLHDEEMKQYLVECFQICWLMAIQDPPVVLGKEVTYADSFDTNLYKHYARLGINVKFVVWPPLLLHESGPVLVKGVAQPIQEKRDEITRWKREKNLYAWEDEDAVESRSRPNGSTTKHYSPTTTKAIINDWQISKNPPQITASAPSSLVTGSNLYPVTTIIQQRTTDRSRSTGKSYKMESVSTYYKQNNDGGERDVHPTISHALSTRQNNAHRSEHMSALGQQDSLSYIGDAIQNDARNSKNKSTQSYKIVSSYTSSTRPSSACNIKIKLYDSAAMIENGARGRPKSTGKRAQPTRLRNRHISHGYESLKAHEQNAFNHFIHMYNHVGERETRNYFKEKYNRYRALQLEHEQ